MPFKKVFSEDPVRLGNRTYRPGIIAYQRINVKLGIGTLVSQTHNLGNLLILQILVQTNYKDKIPPSTSIGAPVIYRDSSEAK